MYRCAEACTANFQITWSLTFFAWLVVFRLLPAPVGCWKSGAAWPPTFRPAWKRGHMHAQQWVLTSGAGHLAPTGMAKQLCRHSPVLKQHIAVYFLKRKSDAASALLKYIDEHSTPLQIRLRHIQSDFGGALPSYTPKHNDNENDTR